MLFGGAGDSEIVGFSDATLRVNELFSTAVIFPDTDCGAAGVCASCGLSVVTAAWTLPVAGANVQTASARARPTKTDTPTLVSFLIAKSLLSLWELVRSVVQKASQEEQKAPISSIPAKIQGLRRIFAAWEKLQGMVLVREINSRPSTILPTSHFPLPTSHFPLPTSQLPTFHSQRLATLMPG